MSAECEKHGVDLHGNTFNGLTCPVCEREAEVERLTNAVKREMSARDTITAERDRLREALCNIAAQDEKRRAGIYALLREHRS